MSDGLPQRGAAPRDALLNANEPPSSANPQGISVPATASLDEVQAQVDAVRGVMQENVGQMLNNMDRASNLETASSELANQARSFQKTARKTKRKMWWNNLKMKLVIGGGLLVLLLIILASSGAFSGKKKEGGDRRLLFAP